MKKLMSILLAVAVVVSLAVIPIHAEAASGMPSELHVDGRYIYNAEGEKVRLAGANIPDLQWATGGDNDLDRRIGILLDQWNANCVRLCVHSKFWFGDEWYQGGNYMDYRRKVDSIINSVTSRGKYVILNLHEFYAITDKNKRFWEDASEVYKNNPGVLFGLLNEPHDISWDMWRNGGELETSDAYGPKTIRVWGHQQILEMIRAKGAKNIVLAGGLDWAYYFNGLTDGYDGLEHGYRLEEPEGANKGNGIIYDTHIYPMKPEYNPVEKAVECLVDVAPILVGEYGHWGERLFDWYDDYLCEYAHVWMNDIHDFIDRHELNYTAWSFHIGASPAMFVDYETFTPTNYSGIYMKYKMLNEEETRPPENERVYEDPTPLYTWKKTVDFDKSDMEFLVYGDEVQCQKTPDGKNGNGMLISFDRSGNDWSSAAIGSFKAEEDFSGATWMSFKIKGDGDMRNIGIGIELTDGREFTSYNQMDLHDNWKDWFMPLSVFKGETGILDTDMIKSVKFTSLNGDCGSFSIDEITIGGIEPEDNGNIIVSDNTQKEQMTWKAWEDSESEKPDSFTVTTKNVERRSPSSQPIKFTYKCPKGSYGGQARATIPKSWDLSNVDYFNFWAKGDGTKQKFMLRIECEKTTNQNEQRSNFKKRELERFCVSFEVNSSEWKQYKFRMSDLGMYDMLHQERIRNISLFNLTLESEGTLYMDDFTFTNVGEPLSDQYVLHEQPKESEAITEIKTEYPEGEIVQIPKEFEITAGEESHISVHIMNKSDKYIKGELKIDGLPIDGVGNAKYECFAGYVSYPHYPWRNYSYSNFKMTIPEEKIGEYIITVSDDSDNGVLPQQYTLRVVAPEKVY